MNAVYLISCKACKKQYVGETRQALNKRMNLHCSDWKTRKFNRSPVAEHFSAAGHSFEDVELCVTEAKETWSDSQRKERETYWIRRLYSTTVGNQQKRCLIQHILDPCHNFNQFSKSMKKSFF